MGGKIFLIINLFQNQVRIKWEKDGGRLPPDRSIDDESGVLVIQDVTVSDSGVYICRVTDGYEVATSNVTLSVGGKYSI